MRISSRQYTDSLYWASDHCTQTDCKLHDYVQSWSFCVQRTTCLQDISWVRCKNSCTKPIWHAAGCFTEGRPASLGHSLYHFASCSEHVLVQRMIGDFSTGSYTNLTSTRGQCCRSRLIVLWHTVVTQDLKLRTLQPLHVLWISRQLGQKQLQPYATSTQDGLRSAVSKNIVPLPAYVDSTH